MKYALKIISASGAGMFVTTVVVGVMSFLSHVTVASRPFTRDVLFYLGAVSWVFLTLYEQRITMGSSIGNAYVVRSSIFIYCRFENTSKPFHKIESLNYLAMC